MSTAGRDAQMLEAERIVESLISLCDSLSTPARKVTIDEVVPQCSTDHVGIAYDVAHVLNEQAGVGPYDLLKYKPIYHIPGYGMGDKLWRIHIV
tara:strand:+ start:15073 stop:15354 length:282 start_codon:yes stop_codon:yes gene_type:complete